MHVKKPSANYPQNVLFQSNIKTNLVQ